MGEILVDLGNHVAAQLIGKRLAHLAERCGWRDDDERCEFVTVEGAGELVDETMHKPIFSELMPIDLFHGAPVRACIIGAAWTIGSLFAGGWIYLLVAAKEGKFRLPRRAVVAHDHRSGAVGSDNPGSVIEQHCTLSFDETAVGKYKLFSGSRVPQRPLRMGSPPPTEEGKPWSVIFRRFLGAFRSIIAATAA